jgi:sterol 24-C-methyltransferase
VNAYYDLATVFYEWGWGPSFHFHSTFPFESFSEGTRRHEYQLAAKLNVTRESHVLDVGCGIGGPMRNIARFLNCKVTGITLNPYQVDRGNEITLKDPTVAEKCESVQGDFMDLPFEKETFSGAYAIEATCHAPNRVACYKQVFDCLKPGSNFVLYEWCMTDKYDPDNKDHQFMKKKIEIGNGLPDITTNKECYKAMEEAGFEMIEAYDYACAGGYEDKGLAEGWMTPLMPSWNPLSQRFQFNWLGAIITNVAIRTMELLWIAPKGTISTQKALQEGAFALRDAGTAKIFSTAYFMVGRKPLK